MGSLRDKFSEITLAGVQEVLGTVNLLDNDITVAILNVLWKNVNFY